MLTQKLTIITVIDQLYNGQRVYTAPMVADCVLNYKARTADVVQNADCYTQFVNGKSPYPPTVASSRRDQ